MLLLFSVIHDGTAMWARHLKMMSITEATRCVYVTMSCVNRYYYSHIYINSFGMNYIVYCVDGSLLNQCFKALLGNFT